MSGNPDLALVVGGIWGLLILASLLVWGLTRLKPEKDFTELAQRTRSWWVMIGIFTLALAAGKNLSVWMFGFISFLALKEYLSMIPTRRADRRLLFWLYLTVPAQYLLVGMHWYGMFIILIPVYLFLLIPIRMILDGQTKGFVQAAGTLQWGLMIAVFAISHAAFLYTLPPHPRGGGGAGLLLFLAFITEFNDVAQYCWGKLLGKRKVVPAISPKKTWEGLLGGVATACLAALALGPVLTPLSRLDSAIAGLIIAVGGFFGDLTLSMLKRDIGVKDTGDLIPGHGGMLDRVDSLIFSAPLFFHFVWYFYY